MLSRVAGSLFWMARYSERTAANTHIIHTQFVQMLEESGLDTTYLEDWTVILNVCGSSKEFFDTYDKLSVRNLSHYLLYSKENFNSLIHTISSIRENARMTRDIIPHALWEEWNGLYLSLKDDPQSPIFSLLEINRFLEKINHTSLTSTGIINTLMSRDEGYHFLKIGRWIERAEKTMIILNELLQKKEHEIRKCTATYSLQLTQTLEDFSKKHRICNTDSVLNYLIKDATCTHSLSYCIQHMKQSISVLEQNNNNCRLSPLLQELQAIRQAISSVDIATMSIEQQKICIGSFLTHCIMLGSVFSKAYYLDESFPTYEFQ
ncbi:alpha-E domain-containing protein [Rummeliibacillus suwonensis]|uniref:alpha-E domain-containing protein n=1 Tax=Rummeliibacillus suwonensis TaxID=1306154 RepID=UPI001AAF9EC8|nr:alpha-E domain-containing protein [Rummeliibacillus suwonensis]MBO2534718.1 alpha-E domain-containing protein [Rummeliibacillus suwonensis]